MTESNFSKNSTIAQEHDFEQPVVSIGSHGDNDIVLAGSGVLPFHATAVVDGEYCRLIPMEPGALILVDGASVGETPVAVEGFQQVEIGNHVLFFQRNGTALRVLMRPINEKAAAQYAANEGENTILLNVFTGEAEIDVEQTAVYEFEVVNAGPIVASFYVTVKGCPAEWVEISPDTINLNEGQRRNVEIQITPPRDPSSHAGTHPIEVIVHSPNYGGQRGGAELSLTIHPYYEYALGNLSPKNQRIRWRKKSGMTYLPITNMSNGPADFSLMAMDDENGCTFDFCIDEECQLTRQATTKLAAGESADVPIQITPTKNPMFAFRNKRYHYTTNVSIPQNPGAPQVLSGSATSVPLFGWWSIMLTIAAFAIAAFFALQPNIRSFDVAAGKDVIELGDTTKLLWDVSPFATRLSISNVDEPINRGQFSRTVAPEASTTYELVSGNWLSGMFGLDQKEIVTVLVVPPTPAVNVFEVDKSTIAKGQPINVRWSVKEADEAFLTIDEVVYPLTKEEFSGEQQVVLEKDALVTLEARNASGSELQSYFVNVVPPYIDINTFTVWVRGDGGAAASEEASASVSGGNKLMSRVNSPDPNFPVKFVELVADPNSDIGYRVVFNPNAREELTKGEQVILEWNVEGAETLQIAPFTEALPSRGSQPFFPQESMNFVMTAQSGDLEGIFMLPVKVFDGDPPKAPTISFFKGSPLSMLGAGDVEFAWSVSGEWTRINLSNADGIIADYMNPVGFKKVNIEENSTIILTAYNGELSSAAPLEIVVNPALKPVGMYFKSAFPATGRFLINQEIAFTVGFYDPEKSDLKTSPPTYVEPVVKPTGQVLVTDGVSICTIMLPAQTCDLTFTTPGDPKEITASYTGDPVYLPATTDSPYDQYISVISSTVTITPTYYLLDRNNPADSVNVSPISVNSNPLKLDTGLFIRATITPQGSPLPSPDAGKVFLYICEQRPVGATFEVIPGSCQPRGFGSVTIVGNNGQADLVLDSFPTAGTFALLLSYAADGFEPAERTEYNVVIEPIDIYLSMPTCTAPKTFIGCEIGTTNPEQTKVVFDIRKKADDLKLQTNLIAPPIDAFEVFEESGTPIPWENCQIVTVTENGLNYHKLECIVDFSSGAGLRSPVNVNFVFDIAVGINYAMSPNTLSSPFSLEIKQNTRIKLDTQKFLNLKVGQPIQLTSSTTTDTSNPDGAIILTDTADNGITTNGKITISVEQTGAFGIDPDISDAPNCTVSGDGRVVEISSITTDCGVFLKKPSTYNISVAFAGDSNFYQSSALPFSTAVTLRDGVTFGWKISDPGNPPPALPYYNWDALSSIAALETLPIRLELGGASPITNAVFQDLEISITLEILANTAPLGVCRIVNGPGISGTFPNYIVKVNVVGGIPVADFSLLCDREPMTVSIKASLPNTEAFELASGQTTERILGILNRGNSYTLVNLLRTSDQKNMINGGAFRKFHIGEEYTLQVRVGRLWGDASTGNIYVPRQVVINRYVDGGTKVILTLPGGLYNQINWTKSTCVPGAASNTIAITMDAYKVLYDFGDPNLWNVGLSDIEIYNDTPCSIYFDKDLVGVTGSLQPAQFSISVANPNLPWQIFSSSVSYSIPDPALDRQTVTMVPSQTAYSAYVDSPNSNITLSLTPQISGTLLSPLDSGLLFSAQFSSSSLCSNLFSGTVTSPTSTRITFTPSAVGGVCTNPLTLTYRTNSWFETTSQIITVEIKKHTPALVLQKYDYGINQYVDFVPPVPGLPVGGYGHWRVGLRNGDDPTTSTSNPVGGTVVIWLEDASGNKLGNAIYGMEPYQSTTAAPGTDAKGWDATQSVYRFTVANTSSHALFVMGYNGVASNITLKYRYISGDSRYQDSSIFSSDPFTIFLFP
jgi:hypothetical protein